MKRTIGPLVLIVLGLVLCAVPHPARAQGSAAVAEALFEQGREAMRAGDYASACDKFHESNRIDPQVGTRLNLATCSEKLGKLATAWALYQGVRDELPPDDDRRPIATNRIAALDAQVPRLTLTLAAGAPANTVVHIGETEVRGAGFGAPLPVDPGEVALVVSAPKHADDEVTLSIAVGERKSLEVAPGPLLPPPAEPTLPTPNPAPLPAPEPDSGTGAQAIAGWTLTALGIVTILGGVGTGIAGLAKKKVGDDPAHCNDVTKVCDEEGKRANDSARSLLTATTINWVAGGVLTAVGVTLVLTADDGDAQTSLTTEAYPGGGGLRLLHRF